MAHRIFKNQNGEIKKIAKGFNWWSFWFSPIYFLYKGMKAPFFRWWLINTFMLIVTIGFWIFIAPIILGFRYEKIAVDYWTEKGFKEVLEDV